MTLNIGRRLAGAKTTLQPALQTFQPPKPANFHVRVASKTDEPSMRKLRTLSRSFTFFGRPLAKPTIEMFFVGQWPEHEQMRWLEYSNVGEYIFTGLSAGAGTQFSALSRMLQPTDKPYLTIMAHDVMITDDISELMQGDTVKGVPVYDNILSQQDWDYLHCFQTSVRKYSGLSPEHFYVKPTDVRFETTATKQEIYPLFDAGLLIVPQQHIADLNRAIKLHFRTVQEAAQAANWPAEKKALSDQIALTLALVDANIPFETLPFQYNWKESYGLPASNVKPAVIQLAQPEGDDTWARLPKTDYKPFQSIVETYNHQMEPKIR